MGSSSSSSTSGVEEFIAISLPHITEHILSFCSFEDLLELTETCITLRDFVTQNDKLMRKFRFSLFFGDLEDCPSFKEIKECLKTRKFKVLEIMGVPDHETINADQNEHFNKFVTMAEHFSEIEELDLFLCKFTRTQFVKIFEIFPSMKKCSIKQCGVDQPPSHTQELTQHNSLIELKLASKYFLCSLELLICKNLKKLSINEVEDREDVNGNSFWQHLRLEPEEIEIKVSGWKQEQHFVNFLKRQTKLKQVTCPTGLRAFEILLQLTSVERFNVSTEFDCPYVNLSKVPHHRLRSFWIQKGFSHSYYLEYSPNAPEDVEMFEHDVLEFLFKNSNLIASVTIGKKSWLEAEFGLSGNFVKKLIANLPKLDRLELFSGSNCDQIFGEISRSGRKFKAIKVQALGD